jgi:hypothetical protein
LLLGFLNSYNDVVKSYFPIIQDQLTANPSYKVIVTGYIFFIYLYIAIAVDLTFHLLHLIFRHSLGGAQALLAGLDLFQREKRLGPKNLSIYTVGKFIDIHLYFINI